MIYVASSWRNSMQPLVVTTFRQAGLEVYDFRNPPGRDAGFSWRDVAEDWEHASTERYREMLNHPIACRGFVADFDGMTASNTCVLVPPCGRSAHAEAGWMKGNGRRVYVYEDWHGVSDAACDLREIEAELKGAEGR